MDVNTRNIALDVFRGLTICFMIIVNTAGNWSCVYWPLDHAKWHGFTPTDLVFPSFLFAVGSSIFFTRKKWLTLATSEVFGKILKRTVVIFLIGLVLFWFPFVRPDDSGYVFKSIENLRIMGVLQRIALCYGIAAWIIYRFEYKAIITWSVCLLLAYWVMMVWGGDFTMLGNLAHKLDLKLIGEAHMYHGEGVAFEPEGLLSTIPAVVNVLAGYLVTCFLMEMGITKNNLMYLALAGLGLLILSWILDIWFPINKKLWTSSFVLHTVAWDMILLAIISYLIDILQFRWGAAFFYSAGRNPLFLYILSELGVILMLFFRKEGESLYTYFYETVFRPFGCHLGSFLFAFTWMFICWSVGWLLDRKGWYLRV
jgi:predicted acyltransferase